MYLCSHMYTHILCTHACKYNIVLHCQHCKRASVVAVAALVLRPAPLRLLDEGLDLLCVYIYIYI